MDYLLKDLKESQEFLNLLLNNINSAVLIADEDLRIYRFNHSFINLFYKQPEDPAGKSFGKAMGCEHTVKEGKPCGETSHCIDCVIRRSLLQTMRDNVPVDRRRLEKVFYINGRPQKKILEFTTRYIVYHGRKMVLAIFYDITEIEMQRAELAEKQRQLDIDLEAAAGIQRSLLPQRLPEIHNCEIAWRFAPCSKVGGDIFNIHQADEHHLAIYMLDVCGHGVSAAFFSVAVYQFLQARTGISAARQPFSSPREILRGLNGAFPFERFESYFSIVYVIIDLKSATLSYGNAGHPPPILLRANGELEILGRHDPVIGLAAETDFGEWTKGLAPRDRLIFYTDGVLDNRNDRGESFGRERFYRVLSEHSRLPVPGLVEAIHKRLDDFCSGTPHDDDITILALGCDKAVNAMELDSACAGMAAKTSASL